MAETNGGNGRVEIKGSLAGQSFTLSTKDILSVLLLLGMFVAIWLLWQSTNQRLDLTQSHHLKMFELLINLKEEVEEKTQTLGKQVTANGQQFRQWLQVHEYNQAHPGADRLPLDLDPAHIPQPKPPQ